MKVLNLRPVAFAAVLIASSAILSACGNNNQLTGQYVNNGTGKAPGTAGMSDAQKCSSTPNVVGTGFYNGVDREYRICKGNAVGAAASQIALFPEDGVQKQVCVFPIQIVSGQPAVIVTNPYANPTSRFAAQCGTIPGSGALMNFGNLQFQGAYVVNYADAAKFATCLATGSVTYCAPANDLGYSVGNF